MEAILLKPKKGSSYPDTDLVVFDEIIQGLITSEYFVPVFTNASDGLRIIPFSFLVENYKFPRKEGAMKGQFLYFISGASPILIKQVEFYKSDEIEIT